ncbi:unnamed protein product [Schistosoma turkestanicum]|nr:unnamed protein product [Schistosoma turkestanicum]
MINCIKYQIKRPDIVRRNQEEAQNATLYILKQYGPTYYLLQDDSKRKYRVHLGDVHTCSCSDYTKNHELCIHLCWILIKRFKVDPNNPVSWQRGLVEREIAALLNGQYSEVNQVTNVTESNNKVLDGDNKFDEKLSCNVQRKIAENDVCPICQEDLFSHIRQPVTFCRKNCGNSVHIRCMKVWTDHQRRQNNLGYSNFVKCPICREDFAPLHVLIREYAETMKVVDMTKSAKLRHPINRIAIIGQANNDTQKKLNVETSQTKHSNTRCLSCLCSPIFGNIYRCEICHQLGQEENINPFLCSMCFRGDKHSQHDRFVYREIPHGKWLDVPSNRGAIKNLTGQFVNELQETNGNLRLNSTNRSNNNYWLLIDAECKPLQLAELAQIRQWTIRMSRNHSDYILSHILGEKEETNNDYEAKSSSSSSMKRRPFINSSIFSTGLLSPGRQCLICLMSFKVNDQVRRLSPGCQHVFHSDCIDPWLLHKSSKCPIDNVPVRPKKPINEKSSTDRTLKQQINHDNMIDYNLSELKICAKHIEGKEKQLPPASAASATAKLVGVHSSSSSKAESSNNHALRLRKI